MPVMSADDWQAIMTAHGIDPWAENAWTYIRRELKILPATSGFGRYVAMGAIYKRLQVACNRGGVFYREMPDEVREMAADLRAEMLATATAVLQNEFATIGARGPQLIFSTGFTNCMGIVLHDSARQIATLGHMALGVAASDGLTRMLADFARAGGNHLESTTRSYLFGGGPGEACARKTGQLVDLLDEQVGNLRHVTGEQMDVDNSFGVHFDRVSGGYGIIRGAVHPPEISAHVAPDLRMFDPQRLQRNRENDAKSSEALMVPAAYP